MYSPYVRIFCAFVATLGLHTATTPPHPPPPRAESVPPTGMEIFLRQRLGQSIVKVRPLLVLATPRRALLTRLPPDDMLDRRASRDGYRSCERAPGPVGIRRRTLRRADDAAPPSRDPRWNTARRGGRARACGMLPRAWPVLHIRARDPRRPPPSHAWAVRARASSRVRSAAFRGRGHRSVACKPGACAFILRCIVVRVR